MPDAPDTPTPSSKAVFLSYTSADTGIALAVCEALRDAGVEVWMDQSELQSGDAWDGNIRRQLKECALIIPIISARTQARREGYFRLEWKLADERMQLVAEGTPLILPVVADDTQQKDALVPKSFLTVQWSRLPHGNVPPAFALRVKKLLGLEVPAVSASTPPFPANPEQLTAPSGSTPATKPVPINPDPAQYETVELMEPIETAKVAQIARTEARPGPQPRSRRLISVAVTLAFTFGIGALAAWYLKPSPKIEPPKVQAKSLVRFAHDIPPTVSLRNTGRPTIAISPDGKSFVYNTVSGLFIRKMDELEAHVIPGTEATLALPVFSPDSQWIAFFTPDTLALSKISIHGGGVVKLCPIIGNFYGLSWGSEGTIVYADGDGSIYRVSENGGTPEKLISANDETLSQPQILPGGTSLLFSSRKNSGSVQVEVITLPKGERKVVIPGGASSRYVASTGHILYVVDGTLFGTVFDLGNLTATGSPIPLQTDIRLGTLSGISNFSLSDNGTLLYLTGSGAQGIFTWVDRTGKEEPLTMAPSFYMSCAISPDGKRLALTEAGNASAQSSISVFNFETKTRTRITPPGSNSFSPMWSADGTKIFYDSGDGNIALTHYNNTRPPEIIINKIENRGRLAPGFLSPDGVSVGFYTVNPPSIGLSAAGATTAPTWLFPNLKRSHSPVLSPDGKWLAYLSTDSGTTELYVSPFPQVDGDRVQISTDQALSPLWSRDGKELVYAGGSLESNRRLMAAKVQSIDDKFTVISIAPVWKTTLRASNYVVRQQFGRQFDISPDGERFLMLKDFNAEKVGAALEKVYVTQNWTEQLKRLVPTSKQ